jgi:hypothetical protein
MYAPRANVPSRKTPGLRVGGAEGGHFAPIGSNGFWTHGTACARFDQQPLEAYAMIAACVEAYALTGDSTWHRAARRCFETVPRSERSRAVTL